jgi:hypothetical protein
VLGLAGKNIEQAFKAISESRGKRSRGKRRIVSRVLEVVVLAVMKLEQLENVQED